MPSKIEWTGESWNPIRAVRHQTGMVGWHCEHASPGCQNCYAETQNVAQRFDLGTGLAYKPGHRKDVEVYLDDAALVKPLGWKKGRKVFVCSMTDLFADFVPDEMIDRIFAVMALCPQHTFQVLTKRSARMREYFSERVEISPPLKGDATFPRARGHVEQWANLTGMKYKADLPWRPRHESGGYWWGFKADMPWPLPNVWLGVSVEDQQRADERIPDLLATPAAVRWISAEPLLSNLELGCIEPRNWRAPQAWGACDMLDCLEGDALTFDEEGELYEVMHVPRLDWVVAGGESGPGARPMHPDWARSLRDQCAAANVPFFFKQWGDWMPAGDHLSEDVPEYLRLRAGDRTHVFEGDHQQMVRVGKKRAGRLLDGVLHDGMPEVPHG